MASIYIADLAVNDSISRSHFHELRELSHCADYDVVYSVDIKIKSGETLTEERFKQLMHHRQKILLSCQQLITPVSEGYISTLASWELSTYYRAKPTTARIIGYNLSTLDTPPKPLPTDTLLEIMCDQVVSDIHSLVSSFTPRKEALHTQTHDPTNSRQKLISQQLM